ncbi:sec-independent protein translocase protein TATB, chloroplastic-like [Zingiber officinale]|uniref:sec-independent protein translocase protein TATB, chloroplastic-like n=1 Tax=Zingiber officinale TaxID=94328 RepID=UPI001C4B0964|nr:sec-independent protein translocase protein TATB, chloroplastic-like [Zingiber officinale]
MLQEVPEDFKSALEQEIGIDEVVSPRNYINKSALNADEKQETVVDPKGKEEQQLAASDAISKVTSQVGEQTSEEQAQETTSETLAAMTTETSIVQSDADTQSSEKSDNQR